MMDEITLDEVNAAVRKHLQTQNLVLAIVTADAEALKRQLTSVAPTPIDYGDIEKPAEVLAEDARIASYPLRVRAGNVRIVPVDQVFEQSPRAPAGS
jgi:zinc protease